MQADSAVDGKPSKGSLLPGHLLSRIGSLTQHWARVSNRICSVISRSASTDAAAVPDRQQHPAQLAFKDASSLSIIIPALNEEARIAAAVRSTEVADKRERPEIIVVDGGSQDGTVKSAQQCGAKVIRSGSGRGKQMNVGATHACGDWLLFLHGDSQLPPDYLTAMQHACSTPKQIPKWGCFESIQLDERSCRGGLLRRLVAWRTHLWHLPYGDQALFLDRATFREVGGFKEWRLLEDVDLVQRLRSSYGRPALVRQPVTVSARRWQRLGLLRTFALNQYILTAWRLGADPDALADKYYGASVNEAGQNGAGGKVG